MSEGVIIYCRCSTMRQACGSSLARQLETSQAYARDRDYRIEAVFSEVASGDSRLPVRQVAERVADRRDCLILCESTDRWSRRDPLVQNDYNPRVHFTSPLETTPDYTFAGVEEGVKG